MKQETLKEAVIRLTSDEKDIAKRLEAVYYITKGAKWQQEQVKKFKNSPIHDKEAIIEMMDELHPKEMIEVVEFIKQFKKK
jgi:hypothetical protein